MGNAESRGSSFASDPITLGRRVAPGEIEAMARRVVRQIRAAHSGPVWSADAWKDTARAMGARILRIRDDQSPGYYDVERKVIYVDTDADDWTLSRRIVHELAHHVLIEYKIRPRRRASERYDDTRQTVEHKIARRVEALVMGE